MQSALGVGVSSNFFLNFILLFSLTALFDTIQNLQIIMTILLTNLVFPANTYVFFSYLDLISGYELLDQASDWAERLLDFTSEEPPVTFWSDIGYESSHFTSNLSSVFFFYLSTPVYMLFLWLFKQLAHLTRVSWLMKYARGHHEQAYWNFFIGFVDGTYLLVCTAALINIRQQNLGQLPADANFIIATIFFLLIVVGFPVFIVINYLLCRSKDELVNENFQER
jgi:hypothetical protein